MKRFGNLIDKIASEENINSSFDAFLKQNPKNRQQIVLDRDNIVKKLSNDLKKLTFSTENYTEFLIKENKKIRKIESLDFYHRIGVHAITNIIGKILNNSLIFDTYASIKGKGLHLGLNRVLKALKNKDATKYCLKLDIKKYYENIDQNILYEQLCKKIKDKKVLFLLKKNNFKFS